MVKVGGNFAKVGGNELKQENRGDNSKFVVND